MEGRGWRERWMRGQNRPKGKGDKMSIYEIEGQIPPWISVCPAHQGSFSGGQDFIKGGPPPPP